MLSVFPVGISNTLLSSRLIFSVHASAHVYSTCMEDGGLSQLLLLGHCLPYFVVIVVFKSLMIVFLLFQLIPDPPHIMCSSSLRKKGQSNPPKRGQTHTHTHTPYNTAVAGIQKLFSFPIKCLCERMNIFNVRHGPKLP